MFKFFKKTKKEKEPRDLKEILDGLRKLEKNYESISCSLENLQKENRNNLQKIGIVRFNPFKEIGGDQSFSIALLDANNNGFVLTSHYGRETNRAYLKPVEEGKSKYQLSSEEEEAIKKATSS